MPFIDLHTHNSSAEKDALKVVNLYPETYNLSAAHQYVSIGLHPWHINEDYKQKLLRLKSFAKDKIIIAIGEAGLDKAVDIDIDLQKEVFIAQAIIAEKVNKPMIIHAVRSHNEIITLRKRFVNAPPWIIHGFSGNEKMATELIRNNFYLSFGKDLFNEKSHATKVISKIPIANIFLETDASGLNIVNIYEKAAVLIKTDIKKLCVQINTNFQSLFAAC